MKTVVVLLLWLGFSLNQAKADVRFPPDAGILNVTDHGAIPDDDRDDTEAIQSMLDQHPSGNHLFYFPDGLYHFSSTLRPALDDGVTKRNIFQGQSQENTVLRLRNGTGLQDAVIDFRAGPAQFFRNAIRDLTVEIGDGNPEASGIKFNASNQGTIRNVTIRCRDQGVTGLDLSHSGEIGPLLITNVTIEGFSAGLVTRWQTASQTVDGLTLRDQKTVGWINQNSQTVFARRVSSYSECTAIINATEGRMLLMDSTLVGYGKAAMLPAIRNQKSMYIRNVNTRGYAKAVTNELIGGRGNRGPDGKVIEEYWANGAGQKRKGEPYKLFPSPNRMLALPIPQFHEPTWDAPQQWASPGQFSGKPNDGKDDSSAIQGAIDSGAKTIYLPRGTWQVDQTVELRGAVNRLIGTEAKIAGTGSFRIVDGDSKVVIVERLEGASRFDHATSRTLQLEHLLGFTYSSSVPTPGHLILSDVVGNPFRIKPRQFVWARQLDIEGDVGEEKRAAARIINDGGQFSVLGFKTEDEGTHIRTINGGRTEVLGSLHVGKFGSQPRFVTIDSFFSSAIVKGGRRSVVEERDGVSRTGDIGNADVYAAFPSLSRQPK